MEVSKRNDSTVYVGLDVHRESIIAAYAVDLGEVQDLGEIGALQSDPDRLCRAYRYVAKISRTIQQRHEGLAKAIICTSPDPA